MKCFIGLGTNLGDRRLNLENAAQKISGGGAKLLRVSPVMETAALVPKNSPASWNIPYLNAVIELEWPCKPAELLYFLKRVERELGRVPSPRWAPRIIDLDILTFGEEVIHEDNLRIPHPELANRAFVLGPLKHLAPSFVGPTLGASVLSLSRRLGEPAPLWMGILNCTPDSFSDGDQLGSPELFNRRLEAFSGAHILDLGAESSRPGAVPLTAEAEWSRLSPVLEMVKEKYRGKIFRPWLSVDTYHPRNAAKALEWGAQIINDVSGYASPEMGDVLRGSSCGYVLMHSLGVPADPARILGEVDPVSEVKNWAETKLEQLENNGISLSRVIFDPGIGFGKNECQSMALLKGISAFLELPVKILVGHSRKGFLRRWTEIPAPERDPETLGISLRLAQKGVDILRVHEPALHERVFRTWKELN